MSGISAASFEQITVLNTEGPIRLIREAVHRDVINHLSGFHVPTRFCHHDDEGITWVRGWHDSAAEEVKAMLVADALGDDKGRRHAKTFTYHPGPSGPSAPTRSHPPAPVNTGFHSIPRRPR